MEALEDFLRREPFPYYILSEALDPFIAHIRDLMGDGISDAFFLLLDFSPSPGMDESIVTQAKATSQEYHVLRNPRSPVNSPARHRSP